MKYSLITTAVLLILTSCNQRTSEPTPLNDPSASYRIAFAPDKHSIHVEGEFSVDEKLLFMFVQGTKELPDGEATFIRNLTMKRHDGSQISLKDLGVGDWEHSAERNERVSVSYDIELNHEKYSWPSGIDEVLYVREDGVFFTGDALFILPGEQIKDIAVTVSVPKGWTISVPWKRLNDSMFTAVNHRDLVVNCGFVGTHETADIRIDSFVLHFAVGGSQRAAKDLFIKTITPAVRANAELFGGSRFTDYLIVIHDDVRSDGGAFRGSFSQLIDGVANANSVVTWGHTMLHELFHLWNGNTMVPQEQEEWFKEGFTDYLTVKQLYALKIFNEGQFLKAMENTHRKYVLAGMMNQPLPSLRAAGEEKAKNRLQVYGGGSLVALMLDIELRERTGGRVGVEELMKKLYVESESGKKRYTLDDIIRISGSLSGSDMRWFFDRTVTGTSPLDLRPYYSKLGLQLDTFVEEVYLSRIPSPTVKQRDLFTAVFGR